MANPSRDQRHGRQAVGWLWSGIQHPQMSAPFLRLAWNSTDFLPRALVTFAVKRGLPPGDLRE